MPIVKSNLPPYYHYPHHRGREARIREKSNSTWNGDKYLPTIGTSCILDILLTYKLHWWKKINMDPTNSSSNYHYTLLIYCITEVQLSRIIYLFSSNMHDASLSLSIHTTCARLMLNLVSFSNYLLEPWVNQSYFAFQ